MSLQEYEAAHQRMPVEVSRTLYQHYDVDKNQCLDVSDMQAEFHLVDHNGNNVFVCVCVLLDALVPFLSVRCVVEFYIVFELI